MALPKKQLREKLENLTPENLNETLQWILEAHTNSLEAIQEERDGLRDKAATAEQLQQQLETLQLSHDNAADVRKELDALKASVAAEKTAAATRAHARSLLKNDVGIQRESALDLILAAEKLDGYEFAEDGTFKNPDAFVDAMKTKHAEWIGEVTTTGVPHVNPPAGGAKGTKDLKDILEIRDVNDRQRAIAENIKLFERN